MKLEEFNYDLPKNLIAQKPVSPRDHSRLLVLTKKTGKIEHKHFYDIINYLNQGDVLVLNNTKVMSARLIGRKAETGGKIEIFLLKKIKASVWQCLVGRKRRRENLKVEFGRGLKAEIIKNNLDGTWKVKFNKSGINFMKIVEKIGRVPLPPYIKRMSKLKTQNSKIINDKSNYQTVYADEKKLGSVAAPTAGLHFTKALLNQLKRKGIQIEYVTLQVGLGTFAPVKVDDITRHKMHAEWVEVDKNNLKRIVKAKLEGRRIITVGTTSVRTLESVFSSNVILEGGRNERPIESYGLEIKQRDPIASLALRSRMTGYAAWTNIFIYPGYKFKIVDAMITNFHLPKSTLLMLVSAFACAERSRSAGRDKIFKAYKAAIKKRYRFYSYGDAMLIV